MFCKDRNICKDFEFSKNGYKINTKIFEEYYNLKKTYLQWHKLIKEYENKNYSIEDCITILKTSLKFYGDSERVKNILLSEVLRPKDDMHMKRSLFELFEKILKLFYLFDESRNKNIKVFHDFSTLKRLNKLNLDEVEIQKVSSLVAFAMPMGYLFVSKFTYKSIELYTPTLLIKREILFINKQKKRMIEKVCVAAVRYGFVFVSIFFVGTYNRFFSSDFLEEDINNYNFKLRVYYDSILRFK